MNKIIKDCNSCKDLTYRDIDKHCISEFGNPDSMVDCYKPHTSNIVVYKDYIFYNNNFYYNPKTNLWRCK